jgi:Tfp pilus assembly PilM family ATPase
MNTLAIDIGSYSIKFLEVTKDRKSLKLVHFTEVIIGEVREMLDEDLSLEAVQEEIIESFLDEKDAILERGFDGKIIFQIPNKLFTTRFLHLPIKQLKKAEQMIPFQLDEEIPYSISEIHYVSSFTKVEEGLNATLHICNLDNFDRYYQNLEQLNLIPAILSTEMSCIQTLIDHSKIEETSFCLVDLGHDSTKVYFFHHKKIVSNHISSIGGKILDENISNTYDIPSDEISIFKHQNSFFLTDKQYESVDEDQQEFAKLMKIVFWPLVMDLKKWFIGHRVSRGINLEKCYITGGTSKITNIENFLSQNLNIPVEILKLHTFPEMENLGLTIEQQCSFQMAEIMSYASFSKPSPANFLTGEYASSFQDNMPLHSTIFISFRTLLFSFFIIIGFLLDWNLLINEEKGLDKIIGTILRKNSSLKISKSQRRLLKKNPDKIYKILLRKENSIKREVSTLKAASNTDAVIPLVQLNQILAANKKVNLNSFKSKNGDAMALFKVSKTGKLQDLNDLEKKLRSSELKSKTLELDTRRKNLKLKFKFN